MDLDRMTDAVVMLTWSDWHREPRSNRYHFATRFAKQVPVYFVQPDREEPGWKFESTEVAGLEIIHVPARLDLARHSSLGRALAERGVREPLYWVYNAHFADYLRTAHSAWTIYHATEDYFSEDFFPTGDDGGIGAKLRRLLNSVDLVVAVSEGVLENARERGRYRGEALVLENGCDYEFWSACQPATSGSERPVALFQGGLNFRVDYEMLVELAGLLKDWDFWFCGRETPSPGWKKLRAQPNVIYFGELAPEGIRQLGSFATAGLIPFRRTEMIKRSLPLKAFEYVASGLPVVSVPIDALQRFDEVFAFARNAPEFAEALRAARDTRNDEQALRARREIAELQGYDRRFASLLARLSSGRSASPFGLCANLLVLYDVGSVHVGTLKEHLDAFEQFSRHRVFYAHCTGGSFPPKDISFYSGIVVHYSVRVNLADHLSKDWKAALSAFRGFKILFIQDEYDTTETARRFIEEAGINTVFTCVPDSERSKVYPSGRFPHVRFAHNLTGYVPSNLDNLPSPQPLAHRPNVFAYRGRALPYWYGDLGQEKQRIGVEMRRICAKLGLPCDIEWDDSKRIYGKAWFEFLGSARATLGTESGANVFDDDGRLRSAILQELESNPTISYEEMREKYLAPHEGKVLMNQISPKIFEAIAMRTALVLFEGGYSGVVKPNVHFIPLRKDFSNLDDVLAKVMDDNYLEAMTNRAFDDVIGSGAYGYPAFVAFFDAEIECLIRRWSGYTIISICTDVIDELQSTSMALGNIPEAFYELPTTHPELDVIRPGLSLEERMERSRTIAETPTKDLIKYAVLRMARRGYRAVPLAIREWLSLRWRKLAARNTGGAGRWLVQSKNGQ